MFSCIPGKRVFLLIMISDFPSSSKYGYLWLKMENICGKNKACVDCETDCSLQVFRRVLNFITRAHRPNPSRVSHAEVPHHKLKINDSSNLQEIRREIMTTFSHRPNMVTKTKKGILLSHSQGKNIWNNQSDFCCLIWFSSSHSHLKTTSCPMLNEHPKFNMHYPILELQVKYKENPQT